jgi:hypothetical protein
MCVHNKGNIQLTYISVEMTKEISLNFTFLSLGRLTVVSNRKHPENNILCTL